MNVLALFAILGLQAVTPIATSPSCDQLSDGRLSLSGTVVREMRHGASTYLADFGCGGLVLKLEFEPEALTTPPGRALLVGIEQHDIESLSQPEVDLGARDTGLRLQASGEWNGQVFRVGEVLNVIPRITQ